MAAIALTPRAAASYFCMHALRREECLDVTHLDIAAAKAGGSFFFNIMSRDPGVM
ncbi:hypothetical protein INS49_015050 [Diaporthe citri]|uniref:uncharacterized protein n=1 Tax=Diaporthe citri TaxID=83186 RepID=UPI001C823F00|nr:uncharacterized protein INS49_015050 [Diaporthe citri]KAG6357172.1 hypothetical protein INS49_015050 [Diaporthe citri]